MTAVQSPAASIRTYKRVLGPMAFRTMLDRLGNERRHHRNRNLYHPFARMHSLARVSLRHSRKDGMVAGASVIVWVIAGVRHLAARCRILASLSCRYPLCAATLLRSRRTGLSPCAIIIVRSASTPGLVETIQVTIERIDTGKHASSQHTNNGSDASPSTPKTRCSPTHE